MDKLEVELFFPVDESYETRREHSERLDSYLGFRTKEIEFDLLERARKSNPGGSHYSWGMNLHHGSQTWVGLSHQTLQTPYGELREICELLNPASGSTVIDLGAGYGRLGLVLATFFPETKFIGYEYVPERVEEGQRLLNKYGCHNSCLLLQDLTADNFALPEAEIYFLYDYGSIHHIRKTLRQIESMALTKRFKVIARGEGTRSLIGYEHPWLSQVVPPIHAEHFSIFSNV